MKKKPMKGQFVRYTPDGTIHRIIGWYLEGRKIATIQNVAEPWRRDFIIISFPEGLNKSLENATKEEAEKIATQCSNCGCTPCECYDLYPWCWKCAIFITDGDTNPGDRCPKCHRGTVLLSEQISVEEK